MVDQVFTFQGPDPKDPKLLSIAMEARVALEPAESVTAKVRTQEGKGSMTFDSETGRIVNSRSQAEDGDGNLRTRARPGPIDRDDLDDDARTTSFRDCSCV